MLKYKELKKLRDALPKNGYELIAGKTGYKKATVGKVLRGERQNKLIIEKAIEVIEEHKDELKALQNKVNTLTK